MLHISRRRFLAIAGAGALFVAPEARAEAPVFYRNPGCGCCHSWTLAMANAGLPVRLVDVDDLNAEHIRLAVPEPLRGCHVGTIGSYVVSGHVPPQDIHRLLLDQPAALGLAVPGMPVGSPGMEYDNRVDPYSVLLFKADGSTIEYARYG